MYKPFRAEIHIPTLIMHNGRIADPLNEYAKAIKNITLRKSKTEADYKALADVELEAGLYFDNKDRIILPGRVFEAAIAVGARKTKEGKDCLASVIVENDSVIIYDGAPMTIEELKNSPEHRITVGTRVGRSRVMRTRPLFTNVKASFEISLNTDVVNAESLKTWIEHTMNIVGIGDWRPRYGRGTLQSFAEL